MPTWRDTNPVDPYTEPVQNEPARGGVSEPTPALAPRRPLHRRFGRWLGATACGFAIFWLFNAPPTATYSQLVQTVPNNWAKPTLCGPNGPIAYVTRYTSNPSVLDVHCAQDNIVMNQATPAGH